jgi:plasmid stabilization system protein ParE
MTVRYSRPAGRRLAEIVAELRSQNPFAVKGLSKRLGQALRRISAFPLSCPRVPEFPHAPIREFFVLPYRFFYFVDEARKTVWIVSVWHGAQLPAEPRLPAP